MNTLKDTQSQLDYFIPELSIEGGNMVKAGFTPGAAFKIEQQTSSLVITLVDDKGKIEQLIEACHSDYNMGLDWIEESGELYLAGEWLKQTGLAGQPLKISVVPGKVVIKKQQGGMLA